MMIRIITVLASALFVAQGDTKGGAHWSYDGPNGPENWAQNYPDCNKTKQSPIDINKYQVVKDRYLKHFNLASYKKSCTFNVTNNGHTVQLYPHDEDCNIFIEGGGLPGRYNFAQMHCHWGRNKKEGSEHTVNGAAFPLECHFVHKFIDNIAVLGILFEVTRKDNKDWQRLIDALSQVKEKGSVYTLPKKMKLKKLLPDDDTFYRYSGSLTTPPCSEGVIWSVFKDTVKISESQINAFRLLSEDESGTELIGHNFRPSQSLNERVVYKSI